MSMQPPYGQDPHDPFNPGPPPAGIPSQRSFARYPEGSYPIAPPVADPLVPADLAGWFQRIIDVVRRSLVPLLTIQAGMAVFVVIYQVIVGNATNEFNRSVQASRGVVPGGVSPDQLSGFFGTLLLGIAVISLVGAYAAAASVHVVIRDAAGESSSVGAALGFAAGRMLPLIGWGLLVWLLLLVGFVVLILPGIYLAIVFAASFLGVVVVERGGIGRCFALVNPRLLPTTGRLLMLWVILGGYSLLIGLIAAAFGPRSLPAAIIQGVLGIPLGIVGIAATVVIYAELRFHDRPGTLTPTLAAELNQ
ncbi:MAG: hypothetical protein ACR2G2_00980 [Pseudonocardia sp.]